MFHTVFNIIYIRFNIIIGNISVLLMKNLNPLLNWIIYASRVFFSKVNNFPPEMTKLLL